MNHLAASEETPTALSLTSLVLGTVGMLLFLFPVLGGPISLLGLFAGGIGWILASLFRMGSLRWAVAGTLLSCLALSINLLIAFAPSGDISRHEGRRVWEVPGRPDVPPPARFGG